MRALSGLAGMAVLAAGLAMPAAGQAQTLTLWSHWADQQAKIDFVESAARAFEAENPGVTIEITWYQKEPLFAALKTALFAGQGPDLFYADADQVEYIENDILLDLTDRIDWDNVEPWARATWTHGDGVYGLPLEAWTVELYTNEAVLQEIGVEMPVEGLEGQDFLDFVAAARAAGVTPMAQGVGDRPYPGAFLTHEILLKMLGPEDYIALLTGDGSQWDDPRVHEALTFAKAIIDSGAFPSDISSIKLGEAHFYFHTNPGAATFQMGSFYPSRAFNPPDAGGQPADFQLGIVNGPIPPGSACPSCKTIAVGGSFVANARSGHPDLAAGFLNFLATPEMGNLWLEKNLVQTGIKADPSSMTGDTGEYFQKLLAANSGNDYAFGIPLALMRGQPKEVFTQVLNNAFPAGLLDVDEAIAQMKAAY